MNEQDKEYLRDLFAGFAMLGLISRGSVWEFSEAWEIADEMMKAREREAEGGITLIKPKRRYEKRKTG